jgi:hypothetical protein
MRLTDGEFEGYLPPTSREVAAALSEGYVILDANVLLGLYKHLQPAREIALDCLRSLGDRLWIPHQVAREYWRHRAKELRDNALPTRPLDRVRDEIRQQINRLTPATRTGGEVDDLRTSLLNQIDRLETQLTGALGIPIDVDKALTTPREDPVATALIEIFDDRIGDLPTDEAEMIAAGLKRFKNQQPPGYKDGPKKADQRPEQGTGDYLLWEQTLSHLERVGIAGPFVIVTSDEKEDWRLKLEKRVLGPHPDLIAEARRRLGHPVFVISPSEFYDELTRRQGSVDPDAVESLIATSESDAPLDWQASTYEELLNRLDAAGYQVQAESIRRAASSGGSVSRAEVYEIGAFDESRSLRRFTLPSRRIMLSLIEDGLLTETAQPPLTAEYDGPGQAIGFVVPEAFKSFVEREEEPTWLEAAVIVAQGDPARFWTVRELIEAIQDQELKDTSRARTPDATLRRDLTLRQTDKFESDGDGRWWLTQDQRGR